MKNIKIIAISIAILMILTLSFFILQEKEIGIQKTNYLGLAKLGLIPTTNQCSHSQDTYTSTEVIARTSNGD